MTSVNQVIEEAQALTRARRLLRSGQAQLIRIDAGLSQGEVARLLGVDPATVSRWENGTRIPRGQLALDYVHLLESVS